MFIVFDIGGTNTRIAASEDGKTMAEPIIYKTPQLFSEGVEQFVATAKKLAGDAPIQAIAGGIPGPMDAAHTQLLKAPNLKDWNGKPLKEELENQLATTVYLENDTAMWGMGEAHEGAGKKSNIVVYITVSTGVGGARIVHGRIDASAYGFEPGHQIIDANGPLCGCGGKGHLEAYISGSAMQHTYGKHPKDIVDEAIWEEATRILAIGLVNASVFWSPDVIILGGSMMKSFSLSNIRSSMLQLNTILPELPDVALSTLGDRGGLIGALKYLWYTTEHGPVAGRTILQASSDNP